MPVRTAFLALTVAALVAGCGDAPPDGGSATADPESATPSQSSASAAEVASVAASVQLEDRDGGASIRVTLRGLEPESRYPVQIHEGPCHETGGISLPLGRVTARPDGTGSVRMTLAEGRLPDRPFSVHVQGPAGSAATCVDVEGTPEP